MSKSWNGYLTIELYLFCTMSMLFHSMAGSMYYSYYYYVFCAGWKHISAAKCSNVIVNTMFIFVCIIFFKLSRHEYYRDLRPISKDFSVTEYLCIYYRFILIRISYLMFDLRD